MVDCGDLSAYFWAVDFFPLFENIFFGIPEMGMELKVSDFAVAKMSPPVSCGMKLSRRWGTQI